MQMFDNIKLENRYTETTKELLKPLITTKKGKFSKRIFNRNKCKIFYILSETVDKVLDDNKELIEKQMEEYFNQFVDIKDVSLGDSYSFEIKSK